VNLTFFLLLVGTVETAIHFVIYEHFKKVLKQRKNELKFADYIAAAGMAKFTASSLCYPHGKQHNQSQFTHHENVILLCLFVYRGSEDASQTGCFSRRAIVPFFLPDLDQSGTRGGNQRALRRHECPPATCGPQYGHCLLHL